MLKFTEEQEWLRVDGDVATIGITAHAAEQLGDIVFVELPEVGATVAKGDAIAVVESVKAASDIYAPIAGEIIAINEGIVADPATVNSSPMDDGWFFKVKFSEPGAVASLLDEDAYKSFIA